MKTKLILMALLSLLSILYSETIIIHKTDGSYLQFAEEEIIEMTFNDVENEVILIHRTDGNLDEIGIAQIENIEFTDIPTETMLIHKTDGTTYEIETILISNITFNEASSIEDTAELISSIPIRFLKNHPNPFNPSTTISFELNEAGFTEIEIFNIRGEIIKRVLTTELSVGSHNIEWDGTDELENNSPSGVYFYKISVNGKQKTNKMILLK